MKKFTRIPSDTFQKLQMNAGILARSFDPATEEVTGLLGATTGGFNFQAQPSYIDLGDDVDNCPKNTMELKILDDIQATASGTFITIDPSLARDLAGAADIDANDATHIIPRNDLKGSDFKDLWWIGDYSDVNTGANAGYCAIHLKNTLNTNGFQIQSTDKGKGQFAFSYLAHYSINDPDNVPYEIYVASSSAVTSPSIVLDKHSVTLEVDEKITLEADVIPSGATVTWSSANTSVATVSGGEITAKGSGNTIITASITQDGVTYSDTCTVVVES